MKTFYNKCIFKKKSQLPQLVFEKIEKEDIITHKVKRKKKEGKKERRKKRNKEGERKRGRKEANKPRAHTFSVSVMREITLTLALWILKEKEKYYVQSFASNFNKLDEMV